MVDVDSKGAVGTRKNHSSSQRGVFERFRYTGGFNSSQDERTSSNMTSSSSKYYSLSVLGGSSFYVGDSAFKGCVWS